VDSEQVSPLDLYAFPIESVGCEVLLCLDGVLECLPRLIELIELMGVNFTDFPLPELWKSCCYFVRQFGMNN
jgi:hypothetical protein